LYLHMEASQHSLLAACFTLHSINATLAIVPQRGAGLWNRMWCSFWRFSSDECVDIIFTVYCWFLQLCHVYVQHCAWGVDVGCWKVIEARSRRLWNWPGWGQGLVWAASTRWSAIKGDEILEHLSDCLLFKMDSAPWSKLTRSFKL
jgi:hypothetical protein